MVTHKKAIVCILLVVTLTACQEFRQSSAAPPEPESSATPGQQAVALAMVSEARQLQAQGKPEDALAAFERAISENPKLTEAHMGMGDVFRQQEDYGQASAAYRSAILTDPNSYEARYFYGLTAQLTGRLGTAIESYKRALIIDPSSFAANLYMASAYLQGGKAQDALPYAQRAIELSADSQAAWATLGSVHSLMGNYHEAVEAYRQTLELGDPLTPILLGLADAHLRLGNYQRAETALRVALRNEPDAVVSERLGYCLYRQSRYEEGVEAYQQSLDADPDNITTLNGMGTCQMALYLVTGADDEPVRIRALNYWRRSLDLDASQTMLIDQISRFAKE